MSWIDGYELEKMHDELARLRAEVEKVRGYEVGPLEAKVAELRAEADALRAGQKLVGYRWRQSAGERWQYSDIPCGWEYEPLYAAMGADA